MTHLILSSSSLVDLKEFYWKKKIVMYRTGGNMTSRVKSDAICIYYVYMCFKLFNFFIKTMFLGVFHQDKQWTGQFYLARCHYTIAAEMGAGRKRALDT